MKVRVRRLLHGEDLPLPSYATAGAAGMDLLAAVDINDPIVIKPGERALIPTGLTVALQPGYEMQIRARSGLAIRNGIMVANGVGTVDEDFRGEVQVILLNAGDDTFMVERGMRIAQAVLAPVIRAEWDEVSDLEETERGSCGFGSTGTA